MTESMHKNADAYLDEMNDEQNNIETNDENCVDADDGAESAQPDDVYLKSDSSSSGSWSIDDDIEYVQPSHKPMFDELPAFSIRSASPSGCFTPIINEPISLFNLSISPISSMEDLSRVNDQNDTTNERNTKDVTHTSDSIGVGYDDDDDRISLEDLTAQINTPPSMLSRSNKRLNLETIFEDVFLETPKKRKCQKFNSWRIETFREITNDERVNSYIVDQQQNRLEQENSCSDTFCNAFDDKIKLNNTISDE